MAGKRLITYGDIAMDITIRVSSSSSLEEDATVKSITYSPGGSASNCAVIAGCLGLKSSVLGTLGNDHWSDELIDDLSGFNICIKNLGRVEGTSGVTFTIVDEDASRKFYSFRGANEQFEYSRLPENFLNDYDFLHLSGYSFQTDKTRQAAEQLIIAAKSNNMMVSLDPSYLFSKQVTKNFQKPLSLIDFIFPNREEAFQMTQTRDPLQSAHRILELGPKHVIVTLDKEGCLIVSDHYEQYIPPLECKEIVNTSGAGDAFCGGFIWGLLSGFTLKQSCQIGNAASVHVITRTGNHHYPPSLIDIQNLVKGFDFELSRRLQKIILKNNLEV